MDVGRSGLLECEPNWNNELMVLRVRSTLTRSPTSTLALHTEHVVSVGEDAIIANDEESRQTEIVFLLLFL